MTEGILTRCDAQCQETYTHTPTGVVHSHQIAHAKMRFDRRTRPGSFAITRGVLFSFYSSAH